MINRFLIVVLLLSSCHSQKKSALSDEFKTNLTEAAAQYKILMKNLPPGKFPKTYFPKTGQYEFSNSGWWCSGFYPATLLYLYEATKDKSLYDEAMRIMDTLKKEQFNKNTHDLGFMMYCPFGNANRIAPKPEYKEILLNSAKSLSTRFNPTVGSIKSCSQ